MEKKKINQYLQTDVKHIDYKDTDLLLKFIDSYARIMPRHKSRISAKNQRKVAKAVKQARYMALLPYVSR